VKPIPDGNSAVFRSESTQVTPLTTCCRKINFILSKGDVYEPRTAAQVAERKHQVEVGNSAAGATEFLTRVSQAILGEAVEWERYDRQRLEALERYATQ